jgi:Protein of unknown function (DUF3102)
MDISHPLAVPSIYKSLDSERCTLIQRKAREIQKRVRRAKQDILDIGRLLIEVRSVLDHGQFESWLGQEIAWSPRTAYNFIYVYERFGDITNFAKMDMDISAAYLLAAPKTPQVVVDEFLNRAQSGERITFKTVRKELTDGKLRLSGKPQMREISQKSSSKAFSTVQTITECTEAKSLKRTASPAMLDAIHPGWCLLGNTHLLFCGDTASPQFNEHIPYAALAVAFTSNDWAHDWLITSAASVIILPEAKFVKDLFEQMLLTFSSPGQAVIFPWLPDGDMLDVAHKLQRRIYAGDPDPERCHRAINAAGLAVSPLSL